MMGETGSRTQRAAPAGDEAVTAAAVRAYIVDNFLLGDDAGLDDDVSLLDSGIVDSIGVVDIIAYLEESFEIDVGDDELLRDNLDSISRLARFVERKRTEGAAPRDSSRT
jgi:acyl carrier protein